MGYYSQHKTLILLAQRFSWPKVLLKTHAIFDVNHFALSVFSHTPCFFFSTHYQSPLQFYNETE